MQTQTDAHTAQQTLVIVSRVAKYGKITRKGEPEEDRLAIGIPQKFYDKAKSLYEMPVRVTIEPLL
jgi:hypothetical protein